MARAPRNTAPQTTAHRLDSIVKSARKIMRKDKGLNGDLDRLPVLTWIMFLKFLDDLERMHQDEAELAGGEFHSAIEPPYRWRDWAADKDGITGPDLLTFITGEKTTLPNGAEGPGLFAYLRGLRGTNGGRDRRDVIATVFRGVSNRMESGYLLRDVINLINGIHFDSSEEIHTLGRLYETLLREMRDAAGDSGEFYTPRAVVRFMVDRIDPRIGETVLDPACGTGGFLTEAFSHMALQADTVEKREQLQSGTLMGVEPKSLPFLLVQMNLLLHGLEAPEIDPGNALRFRLSEIGERERVNVILTNPPFGGEEEAGILSNFPDDRRTAETALLFLQLIMRRLKRKGQGRAAVVVPQGTLFGTGVAARIKADLLEKFNLHTVVRLPQGVFEPYTDVSTNLLFFDTSGPTDAIDFWEHTAPNGRKKYSKTQPLLIEELDDLRSWWDDRCDDDRTWRVRASEVIVRSELGELQSVNLDVKNPKKPDIESNGWPMRPLSDALVPATNRINLQPNELYRQITVRLWGKGLTERAVVRGSEIAATQQNQVKAGQFLISKIDARHGAFGLVPPELDGAVVSSDFPVFGIAEEHVYPEYLAWMSRSDWFVDMCKRASEGSTNRVRLKVDRFMAETVPLPSKPDQKRILDKISVQLRIIEQAKSTLLAHENELEGILREMA
jgi:type I restriction enzyme M protein